MKQQIPHIIELLEQAGRGIMKVYGRSDADFSIEWKDDASPLTIADRQSHDFLVEELSKLPISLPVMSEESTPTEYSVRREWPSYWCLDPLDGTKEFIKRNDQFTINLALIENSSPVLGFIHIPASGETYFASKGEGAFKHNGQRVVSIKANTKRDNWIAVGSNSHGLGAEESALKEFPVGSFRKAGSALKFCMIASGEADVYFRQGPTMEWDTAAGHLLVEEAGALFHYLTDASNHYNKELLVNPPFLVKISA
jgi:3'(2'), 5'-bisphosphate nucleotidase